MPALEKLNIDTPEQVALEFSLATVGSRFLALAVDTLIQIAAPPALSLIVGLVAVWRRAHAAPRPALDPAPSLVLGLFLIYYGYFAVFEAVWNGQTPGKRVIGLRVITSPAVRSACSRRSSGTWSGSPTSCPASTPIGIVSVFVTERSQRLGDLAAGTVVVHERAGLAEEINRLHRRCADATTARPSHGASKLTAAELSVIELSSAAAGSSTATHGCAQRARSPTRMRDPARDHVRDWRRATAGGAQRRIPRAGTVSLATCEVLGATCSVRDVLCAMCGAKCYVRSGVLRAVRCATCGVRRAACGVRRAACEPSLPI